MIYNNEPPLRGGILKNMDPHSVVCGVFIFIIARVTLFVKTFFDTSPPRIDIMRPKFEKRRYISVSFIKKAPTRTLCFFENSAPKKSCYTEKRGRDKCAMHCLTLKFTDDYAAIAIPKSAESAFTVSLVF